MPLETFSLPITLLVVLIFVQTMIPSIARLAMFTPALALALFSTPTELTVTGVWLFLAGRALYVPSYLFGILYVRSACWTAGLVGIGLLLYSAF